jgi:hypothetical protein
MLKIEPTQRQQFRDKHRMRLTYEEMLVDIGSFLFFIGCKLCDMIELIPAIPKYVKMIISNNKKDTLIVIAAVLLALSMVI